MSAFRSRFGAYPRDVYLFFLYTFCASVAIAVFMLVFNLYLVQLDFREDFIGLANALQTFAMAGTAFMLGRLVARLGTWRVVIFSLSAFLVASSLLALATQAVLILGLVIFWGGATSFLFSTTMRCPKIAWRARLGKVVDINVLSMDQPNPCEAVRKR